MKLKFHVLFLVTILNATNSFTQTCIIAKKSKDAIYIGADSRLTNKRAVDNIYFEDTLSMCKVFSEGKYNYAVSGNGINMSPEYIRISCQKGGSFIDVMKDYGKTFSEWIKNDLNRLRVALPVDTFYSFYKSCQPYYNNAIFWGIENDTLFLGMAYFTITLEESSNIKIEGFIHQDSIYAIGHTINIEKLIRKQETWYGNISKKIKELIKIEATADPIHVGGRIHLLKFTKNKGLKWINGKKPPCI